MAKNFHLVLFTVFLMAMCQKVQAQCTSVCIKSGSVAVTGTISAVQTVTIIPTGNYTATTTYSYVTVTGLNNITAGALSVSVSNVGSETALFNGTGLPAGATLNIQIPNATLPAYTYNCLTSSLLVLVNR